MACVKVSVFIIQIRFLAVRHNVKSRINVRSYEVAVILYHLLLGELAGTFYCIAWLQTFAVENFKLKSHVK